MRSMLHTWSFGASGEPCRESCHYSLSESTMTSKTLASCRGRRSLSGPCSSVFARREGGGGQENSPRGRERASWRNKSGSMKNSIKALQMENSAGWQNQTPSVQRSPHAKVQSSLWLSWLSTATSVQLHTRPVFVHLDGRGSGHVFLNRRETARHVV